MKRTTIISIPFVYILACGCLVSLWFILKEYASYSLRENKEAFPWFYITASTFINYLLWVALTPLLYRIATALSRRKTFGHWFKHLVFSLLFALAFRILGFYLLSALLFLTGGKWYDLFTGHSLQSVLVGCFNSFIEYWIMIGVFIAVDYYHRFRNQQLQVALMEKELANSQLEALRMQLHPHFIFNALHTVSCLMEENIQSAQKVLAKLGYLFRTMLDQPPHHTVTLAQEIDYVRSYLDIEQIRFQDRLQIIYDIADNTLNAQVPSLILQPLIENALKHGFAQQTGVGIITVATRITGDQLRLRVEDNGRGTKDVEAVKKKPGIGLTNVKNRLSHLYSDQFHFDIQSSPQGFVATIGIGFVKTT